MDFWYGRDELLQKTLIGRYLPKVYTRPLQTAFAVAKFNKIHFLLVIQPLSGKLERPPAWGAPKYNIPLFQKVCVDEINEEAKKLEGMGIETHDLNAPDIFKGSVRDIFTDGTHLNAEGNRIVANKLFQLINDKWYGN